MNVEDKRLWTFIVRGGQPITLQPKGNIPCEHEGGLSIFKFVLTDEAAKATEALLKEHGCAVVAKTERQTKEQKAERQRLAGVMQQDAVFPCERCPGCSFFDPIAMPGGGYCGVDGWPTEAVYSLMDHAAKARDDLAQCPLEKGSQYL